MYLPISLRGRVCSFVVGVDLTIYDDDDDDDDDNDDDDDDDDADDNNVVDEHVDDDEGTVSPFLSHQQTQ